jgi:hypothetical protein
MATHSKLATPKGATASTAGRGFGSRRAHAGASRPVRSHMPRRLSPREPGVSRWWQRRCRLDGTDSRSMEEVQWPAVTEWLRR